MLESVIFFYLESKSVYFFFFGGGAGVSSVFFTMNPNFKSFLNGKGAGMGGTRLSDYFYKESKSKNKIAGWGRGWMRRKGVEGLGG